MTSTLSLAASIAAKKKEDGLALLPFVAAGFPDVSTSMKLLPAIAQAGAAAMEIGFPFSDPVADGPTIQEAFTVALSKGLKIDQIFEGLAGTEAGVPLVAMVSYSIVYRYGVERFIAASKQAGLSGMLIPDLPPPEAESVCDKVRAGGLDTVLLVSPSTSAARRKHIASLCSGFVYYLSTAGITGERDKLPAGIEENVRQIKDLTDVPVCVGFGLSKRQHLQQLAPVADGAIVGSALVRRVKEASSLSAEKVVESVTQYIGELVRD